MERSVSLRELTPDGSLDRQPSLLDKDWVDPIADNSHKQGRPQVANGSVKWFNSQKGYGFIQPDGGDNDVFVHISAVEQAGLSQLNENQKVSFEIENGRNGKASAINLKLL